jgi:hypothetical protein
MSMASFLLPQVHWCKQDKCRVLEQHDGLPIDNLAGCDHGHRPVNRGLDHVDVLTLSRVAAAMRCPVRRAILSDEEMQFLGHRSRTHVGLKNFARIAHAKACLFLQLATDALLRAVLIEQARWGLDK